MSETIGLILAFVIVGSLFVLWVASQFTIKNPNDKEGDK